MSTVTDKIKKKRNFISIEKKINILDCLKRGERPSSLAKIFNLNEATIRTIQRNENKIRSISSAGSSVSATKISRIRSVIIEKMERALMIWLEDCNDKNIPMDRSIIQQRAQKIYDNLKRTEQSSSEDQNSFHNFSASRGWFENFKKRFSLHNIKIRGEIASADIESAKKFVPEFADIIKNKGYTPDQIFNADETGLYWKKMPQRTYISKNEKHAKGFKVAKERISLLFCSNSSGDSIMKPLLINRSLNPRALKGYDKKNLPVYWRANKKAWTTSILFKDWFYNCFIPDARDYMRKKNLDFKILLILDNAPGHPLDLKYPNVEILFLPPNTTSLIQPLDQGIISTFKAYYIRRTFEKISEDIDQGENLTLTQAWKNFTIRNCLDIVAASVKEIKQSTLNSCWKKLWPEVVSGANLLPPIEDEYQRTINICRDIGGEGFNDMNIHDIQEILEDRMLNEEELVEMLDEPTTIIDTESSCSEAATCFTLKTIDDGLELAIKLENYFIEKDPIMERSSKFKRELQQILEPYKEIRKDLYAKSRQSLITEFLKAKTTITPESTDDENAQPISKKGKISRIISDSDDE